MKKNRFPHAGPTRARWYNPNTTDVLSLRMVKNYMGGLSVRDGRLVNERIGDGRTLIQAACEANKMRKQSEKTSMMTNAMVNAKMIEGSMEYGRGMMDMD